ncbi:adenylate cyclase [Malassezia yamatoensis]|uniref:Adenylate cyclase n=1 Tax=Malassezia yamatoensis TaxID=253288 RepID=A0AAJ5YUE9_9BASI|nr:adenylate cyclase [Malassezia yamatoensis]
MQAQHQPGVIEQRVSDTMQDGRAFEEVMPWQADEADPRPNSDEVSLSEPNKKRLRNPLRLFRSGSSRSAKADPSASSEGLIDRKLAGLRPLTTSLSRREADSRSINSDHPRTAPRWRTWLAGKSPAEEYSANIAQASDYNEMNDAGTSNSTVLDCNFDRLDEFVDLNRGEPRLQEWNRSPTQQGQLPRRNPSPSYRSTNVSPTTRSPHIHSRWSSDSEPPWINGSRNSSVSTAPLESSEWSYRTSRPHSTEQRLSAGWYGTANVSHQELDPRRSLDTRLAPQLTFSPRSSASYKQEEISSTWAAPDSWAVRTEDASKSSLRNLGAEYPDDDYERDAVAEPSGKENTQPTIPTRIIVYEHRAEPIAAPSTGRTTPTQWPEEHPRRPRRFPGRRSNKLEMLFAPELATSYTRGSSMDENAPPLTDEPMQRSSQNLSVDPLRAPTSSASTYPSPTSIPRRLHRHAVHPPHLPFRRFARKSDSSSSRSESNVDPEIEATAMNASRATAWHFSTRRRGDQAPIEADANAEPMGERHALTQHESNADAKEHPNWFLRVYLQDDSFFRLSCTLETTAAEIIYVLSRTLNSTDTQAHGLFLYEKCADRPLVASERPARILRRRLLQAGYNEWDRLESLGGEDMSYVLRFMYRPDRFNASQWSMAQAQDHTARHLNMQGMHLTLIPVALYKDAHWIVSLDLSRNPLTDVPLDFIERCTQLRSLRLSMLALKYVPQSIAAAHSLTHLNLTTNRIFDLEHIALHTLPELKGLRMLNNRLSRMPSYTPDLASLTTLNISNNRFDEFPLAVCTIPDLRDLDVSFNSITSIPEEIAQLSHLERLVLMGNKLNRLPDALFFLKKLCTLDVRNTEVHHLGQVLSLPCLDKVLASHNSITTLDGNLGTCLTTLDLAHNPLSRMQIGVTSLANLTKLDVSHANLATLSEHLFNSLNTLTHLILDHNKFATLPPLKALSQLEHLSCAANALTHLPDSLGELGNLQRLDVQNNNLRSLPAGIWHCATLYAINASSNVLETFPAPPDLDMNSSRAATETQPRLRANPLRFSLTRLRLADNRLKDDVFPILALLSELEVLNLSMNELYEVPSGSLLHLSELRELYLSGNQLRSLPAEDLERLERLLVLFVNGNKLTTLPAELGKLKQLRLLDVGNNFLKYNIANWHYDWNWNANLNLRYLNLSGNQRFEITPLPSSGPNLVRADHHLANFSRLQHLRLLGLMEVTMTHQPLPDESDHRRVRTTLSQINTMPYGIADSLGADGELHVIDVVLSHYRQSDYEALFGLVDGCNPAGASSYASYLSRFIAIHCGPVLASELQDLQVSHVREPQPSNWESIEEEKVKDALRRAFLRLDQKYASHVLSMDMVQDKALQSTQQIATTTGSPTEGIGKQEMFWGFPGATPNVAHKSLWEVNASAILAYQRGRRLYIANVGDALAVLSRVGGSIQVLGTEHNPLNRDEIHRIRNAEGWVSLRGYVNDELPVARAFGHFQLTPIVNACPSVQSIELSDADELVIIGNAELWRYISYQMAVDIARMDRDEPRVASERLRDTAISYGATNSIAVMVVAVGKKTEDSSLSMAPGVLLQRAQDVSNKAARRQRVGNDSTLARLEREVLPPIGQVALVFTDIKHSTFLWETNPGMQTAIRQHNLLLRRQLRSIGGYEAKTEGDAFMVSFPSVTAALLWCFSVQLRLLNVDWPQEILESDDGFPVYDQDGTLLYRGLSVRMGIHWGSPVCEVDPVNNRMDYFGPMVNRAARISNAADGGQILVSRDVVNALENVLKQYEDLDGSSSATTQPSQSPLVPRDVVFLRRLGLGIISVGERRLKGIECPEHLSLVYPKQLSGRYRIWPGGRINHPTLLFFEPTEHLLDIEQVKLLGILCLRLEALSGGVCLPGLDVGESTLSTSVFQSEQLPPHTERNRVVERLLVSHPELLIIASREEATDTELMHVFVQLVTRICNAIATLTIKFAQANMPQELAQLQQLAHWLQAF